MKRSLHLILKFQNNSLIVDRKTTDTITEHKKTCDLNDRLIWGQGSEKEKSGVALKNRLRFKRQIDNNVNTYTFFLTNNRGERELYVGKLTNIYDKGEISADSDLIQFIPSYYSSTVGMQSDSNNLFVDVNTFIKIDNKYLDNISLESTGNKVLTVKNFSSIFLANIEEELEIFLTELFKNPEYKFQYEIEQEELSDEIKVDDQPKAKPSKVTVNGTKSYKRDSKVSKKAIVLANYLCEVDSNHKEFKSKVTKENYVEAHHLIPMEFQGEYDQSIDVEANIISLCASCHKRLHHAEYGEVEKIIENLYNNRIGRLDDCGIQLTMEKLLSYYK